MLFRTNCMYIAKFKDNLDLTVKIVEIDFCSVQYPTPRPRRAVRRAKTNDPPLPAAIKNRRLD